MANDTQITIVGHTTAPPELRFTQSGTAVANFTVASTPRTFDRQANEWKDGETLFLRCTAWREMAEHIAESLTEKGVHVIVQGNLRQRSYQDRDGNQRTSYELDVLEVGPSLRYATAQPVKAQRGGFQQRPPQQAHGQQWAGQPTQGGAQPSELGYQGGAEEPPF